MRFMPSHGVLGALLVATALSGCTDVTGREPREYAEYADVANGSGGAGVAVGPLPGDAPDGTRVQPGSPKGVPGSGPPAESSGGTDSQPGQPGQVPQPGGGPNRGSTPNGVAGPGGSGGQPGSGPGSPGTDAPPSEEPPLTQPGWTGTFLGNELFEFHSGTGPGARVLVNDLTLDLDGRPTGSFVYEILTGESQIYQQGDGGPCQLQLTVAHDFGPGDIDVDDEQLTGSFLVTSSAATGPCGPGRTRSLPARIEGEVRDGLLQGAIIVPRDPDGLGDGYQLPFRARTTS